MESLPGVIVEAASMYTSTLVWSGLVLVIMTHCWSRRYLVTCGKGRTWSAGGEGGWRGGGMCVHDEKERLIKTT